MPALDTGGAAVSAPPATGNPGYFAVGNTAARQRLRDPVSVTPFLEWCERREEQLRREFDHYPRIGGHVLGAHFRESLVLELGWDPESGARRLYTWRHPNHGDGHSGYVERETIEKALLHAGVMDTSELYPLPEPRPGTPLGQGAHMTEEQFLAAHVVYLRGGLTVLAVAHLIYERYNYPNPEAARCALRRGWSHLDLELRRCSATTASGKPCRKPPLSGRELCAKHDPRITVAWSPPAELVERARALYMGGRSFKGIGRDLVDETPWSHWTYVGKQFSKIGRRQGWNTCQRGTGPPRSA